MLLSLIRTNVSPSETTGILLIGGKPFCGTIEPPVVPNAVHPKGALPLGWYRLTLSRSPLFGRVLPRVNYVPGFDEVRIRSGNNCAHTSGDILVGQLCGNTLLHSRQTEQDLLDKLWKHPKEEHYIEITTPDRFFTEHCSTLDTLACLLRGAQYDE